MNRIPISSSDIASIGYDVQSKTLEVEFLRGQIYQYFNVPENIYGEFVKATSHGTYFHKHIKNNFSYKRVS
jgi:hypothetical protein